MQPRVRQARPADAGDEQEPPPPPGAADAWALFGARCRLGLSAADGHVACVPPREVPPIADTVESGPLRAYRALIERAGVPLPAQYVHGVPVG